MKGCSKLTQDDVVAIDDKQLKGSFNQSGRHDALYMISAFACENGFVWRNALLIKSRMK